MIQEFDTMPDAAAAGALLLRVAAVFGLHWRLSSVYLATPMRVDGLAIGS